jgi:thienamycin biosynthesis protein ThnO
MAVQGSGRLCTNMKALIVDGDPAAPATSLAAAMARWSVAPLDDPQAIVPAFPDRELARRIDATIAAAEARGAVDLSARFGGRARVVDAGRARFLRPTVLLVDRGDPIFGAELPFPFVTVARVPRREIAAACRGSLVVSVIGDDMALVRELVREPTVDKVLHGEHIDRGYRATDPHEGFLADFLFHKKAVWPPSAGVRLS